MTAITLFEQEPEFAVERLGSGDVQVTVHAGDTIIRINVGRIHEDVSVLAASLHHLAEDIDQDILEGWEDTPDEYDGYIGVDRGRYHVRLDGRRVGDYPSREVAEIELARAMVTDGVFPNLWFVNERGYHEPIHEAIRRWHTDTGDAMVSLGGVEYQPGDRVRYAGMDWPYVVLGDWGPAGVEIHTDGDPSIRAHVTDRADLHPITE
jgi:hypothetical protein